MDLIRPPPGILLPKTFLYGSLRLADPAVRTPRSQGLPNPAYRVLLGSPDPAFIFLQLGLPKIQLRLGQSAIGTTFMPMPEASMHKDNFLMFGEDQIRATRKFFNM